MATETVSQRSAVQAKPSGLWWQAILLAAVVAGAWFFAKPLISGKSTKPLSKNLLTHTIKRADLRVAVTEQGTLESSENTEIKCKVRGDNTVIWVVENGTTVSEGDDLVRLDTLAIEDVINERSKFAHWSQSGAESARATARRAKLAINQYLEGTFVTEVKNLEKDLAVAQSNLKTAENMLRHTKSMFERGYASGLDVEDREFAVVQAKLNVGVQKTQIEVLKTFTKAEQLEQLNGDLKAAEANLASMEERAKMDGIRRDLAAAELELCVIKAPKSGMVIFPSAQEWKSKPDVEEGATVHYDQVMLLMPDVDNMQVKVGIHESMVEKISPGLPAKVTLGDQLIEAKVSEVAAVARPAGWWTGNVVKYDTIVALPESETGLRPGMSAEVEVILADHKDVLTIPVGAVIETQTENLCWVKTGDRVERRVLSLGDSNDVFIVVKDGVKEGEEAVLNPRAFIEEARQEMLKTIEESEPVEKGSETESADDESYIDESANEQTNTLPLVGSSLSAKPTCSGRVRSGLLPRSQKLSLVLPNERLCICENTFEELGPPLDRVIEDSRLEPWRMRRTKAFRHFALPSHRCRWAATADPPKGRVLFCALEARQLARVAS